MHVVGQPYWRLRDYLRTTPGRLKRQERRDGDRQRVQATRCLTRRMAIALYTRCSRRKVKRSDVNGRVTCYGMWGLDSVVRTVVIHRCCSSELRPTTGRSIRSVMIGAGKGSPSSVIIFSTSGVSRNTRKTWRTRARETPSVRARSAGEAYGPFSNISCHSRATVTGLR